MKILDVKHLSVEFPNKTGAAKVLDNISFYLNQNETLGLVGESGSGKSMTALSIMGLLPRPAARISSGEILLHTSKTGPINTLQLTDNQFNDIRRSDLAMIYQAPASSLNPVFTCGLQVAEVLYLKQGPKALDVRAQVVQLFRQVKLNDPEKIHDAYPHQISGGEKQRVMIAMALAAQPALLIADEPTTALDPTVQKSVLDLLKDIRQNQGLSMLFISHDLGVIANMCDRVAVMKSGVIVEEGPVKDIINQPQHPYTRDLVNKRPALYPKSTHSKVLPDPKMIAEDTAPILGVRQLSVRYPGKKNWYGQVTTWNTGVDQLSFELMPGQVLGIAGESGCGKTTLGKAIAQLVPVFEGQILYKGQDINQARGASQKALRRDIQLVFQHPYPALNPSMTIEAALAEPILLHRLYPKKQVPERVVQLLELVGLSADQRKRYPVEFSGGQQQRICIARALALEPRLLICDEVVSSLDVSVQAMILELLQDLKVQLGLSYLFISHDLAVIRQLCDQVLLMDKGRKVVLGAPEALFEQRDHALLNTMLDASMSL